jgi:hypothetical protein
MKKENKMARYCKLLDKMLNDELENEKILEEISGLGINSLRNAILNDLGGGLDEKRTKEERDNVSWYNDVGVDIIFKMVSQSKYRIEKLSEIKERFCPPRRR